MAPDSTPPPPPGHDKSGDNPARRPDDVSRSQIESVAVIRLIRRSKSFSFSVNHESDQSNE